MKRSFHIGDVLSITTGRLVSNRHAGGVCDILNYMTGDNLFTHQLPGAADECRPVLLKNFPQLAHVDASCVTVFNLQAWLTEQVALFGETLEVETLADGQHRHKDALTELVECVGPDRVVVLAPTLNQDPERERRILESIETGPPLTVKAQAGGDQADGDTLTIGSGDRDHVMVGDGLKLSPGWKPEDTKGGDLSLTQEREPHDSDSRTITFSGGAGWAPYGKIPLHGRMRFIIPTGEEIMRIEGDGRVFVRGVLERTNKGIVDTFAEWLASAAIYSPVVGQLQQLLAKADEFAVKVKDAEDAKDLHDDAFEFVEVVRKACGGKR